MTSFVRSAEIKDFFPQEDTPLVGEIAQVLLAVTASVCLVLGIACGRFCSRMPRTQAAPASPPSECPTPSEPPIPPTATDDTGEDASFAVHPESVWPREEVKPEEQDGESHLLEVVIGHV